MNNPRLKMGITQSQYGRLFGVHEMTVSKWERGILTPNPHQRAIIDLLGFADTDDLDIEAIQEEHGSVYALWRILEPIFREYE